MSTMTESDAREVQGALQDTEARYDDGALKPPGGLSDNEPGFPAKYFAKREDEKRVRLIQEYHEHLNKTHDLNTIYQPTEADYNVLLRKDAEKELLGFETFLQNYFDLTDPIHQRLVREIYPNYFERRLEVIRDTLSAQEKLARIKLFGAQTKEDIFFLYAIYNGDVHIPKAAVFDTHAETTKKQFQRGFLNWKRWAAEPTGTKKRVGQAGWEGILSAAGKPMRKDLPFDPMSPWWAGHQSRKGGEADDQRKHAVHSMGSIWGFLPPPTGEEE